MESESHIVRKAEMPYVGHDVVGPMRAVDAKSGFLQDLGKKFSSLLIIPGKRRVIAWVDLQSNCGSLLERMRRSDGQEIMNLADRRGQMLRSNGPSDAPSGEAVRL